MTEEQFLRWLMQYLRQNPEKHAELFSDGSCSIWSDPSGYEVLSYSSLEEMWMELA